MQQQQQYQRRRQWWQWQRPAVLLLPLLLRLLLQLQAANAAAAVGSVAEGEWQQRALLDEAGDLTWVFLLKAHTFTPTHAVGIKELMSEALTA